MIKVKRTVRLASPPEQVWPWVADPSHFAEWRKGAGVTRATAVGDGPMTVGSRFTMDVTTQGRAGTITCTVTTYDVNRRFAFESMDQSGFAGAADTQLQPDGGGTTLTFDFWLRAPGAWRLLEPLIGRAVTQAADTDFSTLRGKLGG